MGLFDWGWNDRDDGYRKKSHHRKGRSNYDNRYKRDYDSFSLYDSFDSIFDDSFFDDNKKGYRSKKRNSDSEFGLFGFDAFMPSFDIDDWSTPFDGLFGICESVIGTWNSLWELPFEYISDAGFWSTSSIPPIRIYPSPEDKGKAGESIVAATLKQLPSEDYVIINDILLDIGTTTSQIDHIVVSVYGIFVIETKHYAGSIYGNAASKEWSQYVNGKQYKFYNPLMQNQGHCYALSKVFTNKLLNYIIPITVFSKNCNLKIYGGENLLHLPDLIPAIKKYNAELMSREQMNAIADKIRNCKCNSEFTKWESHIRQVQEKENT